MYSNIDFTFLNEMNKPIEIPQHCMIKVVASLSGYISVAIFSDDCEIEERNETSYDREFYFYKKPICYLGHETKETFYDRYICSNNEIDNVIFYKDAIGIKHIVLHKRVNFSSGTIKLDNIIDNIYNETIKAILHILTDSGSPCHPEYYSSMQNLYYMMTCNNYKKLFSDTCKKIRR